jgi:hypothetical protein
MLRSFIQWRENCLPQQMAIGAEALGLENESLESLTAHVQQHISDGAPSFSQLPLEAVLNSMARISLLPVR